MKKRYVQLLFLILSILVVSNAGASEVMVRLFGLQDCSIESLTIGI